MQMQQIKKKSSLKNKLLIVFCLLVLVSTAFENFFVVRKSRYAILEKVENHLKDKANNTVEIVNGRIESLFQFLEGISRMPFLRDDEISYSTKAQLLKREVQFNKTFSSLYLVEKSGKIYFENGKEVSYLNAEWFRASKNGKSYITKPFYDDISANVFVIGLSVPIYDNKNEIIAVLYAQIDGTWLCENIKDIVVGKTGYCYIIEDSGITIADGEIEYVKKFENTIESAKSDASLVSMAEFEKQAINASSQFVGFWTTKGISHIASFAKLEKTGWIVIVQAPVDEFLSSINVLRLTMSILGGVVVIAALIIIYPIIIKFIKPIQMVVGALKDIAQGDGDLSVRLPITGNDEITDLSNYFNETIKK